MKILLFAVALLRRNSTNAKCFCKNIRVKASVSLTILGKKRPPRRKIERDNIEFLAARVFRFIYLITGVIHLLVYRSALDRVCNRDSVELSEKFEAGDIAQNSDTSYGSKSLITNTVMNEGVVIKIFVVINPRN